MAGDRRFPRIYALLKAAGHDSAKAAEILRDARCNDAHARTWIKTIAASRWSTRRPIPEKEASNRARLFLLAYAVLDDLPAGEATEEAMLSLLSRAFFTASWLRTSTISTAS
jgi:hypothetical protein